MLYDETGNPIELRAIMVCVNWYDYLAITLAKNKHHFTDSMIVTNINGLKTKEVALSHGSRVFQTDAFYDDGAEFNKWKALEQGLDHFGRHGWIAIMDADVIWPHQLPKYETIKGKLYCPLRRMFNNPELKNGITPPEHLWNRYPFHRYTAEFSGYTMIFHAEDSVLGPPPWHETNWRHAGGGDTFFQKKWLQRNKIRPPWDVLHLGVSGQWAGRTQPFLDGSPPPPDNLIKNQRLKEMMRQRKISRNYNHEKLK